MGIKASLKIKFDIKSIYLVAFSAFWLVTLLVVSPWSPLSIYSNETYGTLLEAPSPCTDELCTQEPILAVETNIETYFLVNNLTQTYYYNITQLLDFDTFYLYDNVIVIGEILELQDYYGETYYTINVENIYRNVPDDGQVPDSPFNTTNIIITIGAIVFILLGIYIFFKKK